MKRASGFQFLLVYLLALQRAVSCEKPLHGKHLKVFPFEIESGNILTLSRNASGHITEIDGRLADIFHWLSQSAGFTYDMVTPRMSNSAGKLSFAEAVSLLSTGEIDMVLQGNPMVAQQLKFAYFLYPWTVSSFSLLMPFSKPDFHVSAPWKPFDMQIWILLLVTIFLVSLMLYAIGLIVFKFNYIFTHPFDDYFTNVQYSIEYVLLVLLSQGGVCCSQNFSTRIIAAVWCLAAFVLVNSFSSVLISSLTSPSIRPLVKSIYDLYDPTIHMLTINKDAPQMLFSTAESGILKFIGDDIRRHPSHVCSDFNDCLNRVKNGRYVYASASSVLSYHIKKDFARTGQCHMTIAKEPFIVVLMSMPIKKDQVLFSALNHQMIKLWETGLLDFWKKRNSQNAHQCLDYNTRVQSKQTLGLINYSSTFAMLCVGLLLSLFVFATELVAFYYPKIRSQLTTRNQNTSKMI